MKIIWSEENTFGEVLLRTRPGLSHAIDKRLPLNDISSPVRVIRKQTVADQQLSSGSLTETLAPRDWQKKCVCESLLALGPSEYQETKPRTWKWFLEDSVLPLCCAKLWCPVYHIRMHQNGAGDCSVVRALGAFPEDLGSVSSAHMVAPSQLQS